MTTRPLTATIALILAVTLLAGCSVFDSSGAASSASDTSPAATVTAVSPTRASRTPAAAPPRPTAPKPSKDLVTEAITANKAAFEVELAVSRRGGFPGHRPEPKLQQFLMGDLLAEVSDRAVGWYEEKLRPHERSTQKLSQVRASPVGRSGSLVALEMCRDQSELKFWIDKTSYRHYSTMRTLRFFKRDRDGALKAFYETSHEVDNCGLPAVPASASTSAQQVLARMHAIEENYRAKGGIDWARHKTPDLPTVLTGDALRWMRSSLGEQHSTGWTQVGKTTHYGLWSTPFKVGEAAFALTQCEDARGVVYSHPDGTHGQGDLTYYTAWFVKNAQGDWRVAHVGWFVVHSCG